ncbi:MAG: DUF4089 domain-containing protein [Betaproteobacteria bacterium]|nr:DUF4089 domain-containing protein [Betaproteobacteria bacterium]
MGATSKPIDAATVARLLELNGIDIPEDRLPQVVTWMQRIQAVAAVVLAAELEPKDEQAPVWRP